MRKIFTFLAAAVVSLVAFNAAGKSLVLYSNVPDVVSVPTSFGDELLETTPYSYDLGEGTVTITLLEGQFEEITADNGDFLMPGSDYFIGENGASVDLVLDNFESGVPYCIHVDGVDAPPTVKNVYFLSNEEDVVVYSKWDYSTWSQIRTPINKEPVAFAVEQTGIELSISGANYVDVTEYNADQEEVGVYTGASFSASYYGTGGTLRFSFDGLKEGYSYKINVKKPEPRNVIVDGDVDNISVVNGWGGSSEALNDGVYGPFTVAENSQYTISAQDGYIISSVLVNETECIYSPQKQYVGYYTALKDGENTVTVGVLKIEDLRTSTVKVTVNGTPSKIRFTRKLGGTIDLTEGTQEVAFSEEYDLPIAIESTVYNQPLYKVLLGETPVEATYGTYSLYPANQDEITIDADFPEEPVVVNLTGNLDAISAVYVNNVNQDLAEVKANGKFDAMLGNPISIQFDSYGYDISSITLNGTEKDHYSVSWTASETEYTLNIEASKKVGPQVTFIATDYENVKVYSSYSPDPSTELVLTDEVTTLEFPPSSYYICVEAPEGWLLNSVSLNGTEKIYGGPTTQVSFYVSSYELKDGTVIIDNVKVEMDANLILYAQPVSDDLATNDVFTYYSVSTSVGSKTFIEGAPKGYKSFEISTLWSPITLNASVADGYNLYVYLNDEVLENTPYIGFRFTPTETNILKVFYEEPAEYKAKFNIADGTEINLVTDTNEAGAKTLTGVQDIKGLQGTLLQFTIQSVAERAAAQVKVNGETIVPEDGVYSVTLDDNLKIEVASGLTGIDGISAENDGEETIFNLQGVRINNNVKELPAGIYIVNGKKVVR